MYTMAEPVKEFSYSRNAQQRQWRAVAVHIHFYSSVSQDMTVMFDWASKSNYLSIFSPEMTLSGWLDINPFIAVMSLENGH